MFLFKKSGYKQKKAAQFLAQPRYFFIKKYLFQFVK